MNEIVDFLAYSALGIFTITFSVVATTALIMLLIDGLEKVSNLLTGYKDPTK